MSQLVEITINRVEIAVRRDEEADVFVGFCPRFEVYSQADTKDDAIAATTDAVCMRLATAFDHGRVDKILRRAGYERLPSGEIGLPSASNEEFVALTFKEGVEVTEVGIRVPIAALLHERSIACQH